MYQQFYGLRELPFELTPNPKFLYLTPKHREALSTLHYALAAGKSITVLVGEAGTGKTTLLRAALESEHGRRVRWFYLNNPVLTREDFIRTLAVRFQLGPGAADSKAVFLDALERALVERRAQGQTTVLVVDEAQSLGRDLLEEIRLLANIETSSEKLLVVILAGQPEFAERLNEPGLRQLKQRVALRCEIAPFELAETAAYIGSRIVTAGGVSSRLFTREAVEAIHLHSQGIPRTINVICDNALLGGLAVGRPLVDRKIVLDVARDFDLGRQSASASAPDARNVGPVTPAPATPPAPVGEAVGASPPPGEAASAGRPRRFAFFRAVKNGARRPLSIVNEPS
jgi:type II secretory pathway predicted ATPase ExeA